MCFSYQKYKSYFTQYKPITIINIFGHRYFLFLSFAFYFSQKKWANASDCFDLCVRYVGIHLAILSLCLIHMMACASVSNQEIILRKIIALEMRSHVLYERFSFDLDCYYLLILMFVEWNGQPQQSDALKQHCEQLMTNEHKQCALVAFVLVFKKFRGFINEEKERVQNGHNESGRIGKIITPALSVRWFVVIIFGVISEFGKAWMTENDWTAKLYVIKS